MNQAAPATSFISRTGGFQIVSTNDALDVFRDKKAREDEHHFHLRWLAYATTAALAVLSVLMSTSREKGVLVSLLLVAVVFGAAFVLQTFASARNIHCTAEAFQVIQTRRGKDIESWSFPRTEVSPIHYAVFSTSRYGSICGLLFTVQDQEVQVLHGLEIIEAQQVLRELERLGYKIEWDVAMPMAVEIARERRKSIFH